MAPNCMGVKRICFRTRAETNAQLRRPLPKRKYRRHYDVLIFRIAN